MAAFENNFAFLALKCRPFLPLDMVNEASIPGARLDVSGTCPKTAMPPQVEKATSTGNGKGQQTGPVPYGRVLCQPGTPRANN